MTETNKRAALWAALFRRYSVLQRFDEALEHLFVNYTVRMWIVQAEPRPITWAWPALALGTRRSLARSSWVRCHTTSQMFATPVAPSGWPLESRPPDTLTGA